MAQAKQMKPTREKKKFKFTRDMLDGLAKQNVVLMTGIVNAPVIIAATTFKKGVVIALAFAIISFLTIFTCSFVPKKIAYALRVIIYALVGSVYYIPTVLMLEEIFPLSVQLIGIYMPLIISNALIFSKTESRFYLEEKSKMIIDVIIFIMGFSVVCVITGGFRELICFGTFAGIKLLDISIAAFEAPFGGFILVGIMAGMFRAIYNRLRNRNKRLLEEEKADVQVSDDSNIQIGNAAKEKANADAIANADAAFESDALTNSDAVTKTAKSDALADTFADVEALSKSRKDK